MNNSNRPIHPIYDHKGVITENPNFIEGFNGLSKREYFASMAMIAILLKNNNKTNEEIIKQSYEVADEFLKFIEKEQ
jgi:ATP-dependent protease HslVU (ClpYQ) peptidase subunit